MTKLEGVLDSLTRFDGVIGALVLGANARTLAKSFTDNADSKGLTEALEAGLQQGGRVSSALGCGLVERQQIQYADEVVLVESLAGGGLLALLLAPGANQGRVRLEIRKKKAEIEAAAA